MTKPYCKFSFSLPVEKAIELRILHDRINLEENLSLSKLCKALVLDSMDTENSLQAIEISKDGTMLEGYNRYVK